jgi:hypothetical protein
MRIQTQDDAAKTLPVRELAKAQTQELLPAWESMYPVISVECRHAFLKLVSRENRRQLAEDVGAGVHAAMGKCVLIFLQAFQMSKKTSGRFSS